MSFTIKSQRIIDRFIFSPIACLFGLFKINSPLDKKRVKRILVIKLWALGDSINLLPLFEALKEEFPNAKIDVLAHTRNKMVFEGQKNINKIIDFGTVNILKLFRKYDLGIDAEPALNVSAVINFLSANYRLGFSHGIRSKTYNLTVDFSKKQHMVQNYLDFARKLGSTYDTDLLIPLVISKEDKKEVDSFMNKHKIMKNDFVVGITPGVAESVKYRMWPEENFAKLADELIDKHNAKVIFVDSKSNKKTIEQIMRLMKTKQKDRCFDSVDDFGNLTDIKKSSELAKRCSVFVSNDSGIMHISAAHGTKTIGLFGPNTPVLWGPYGKNNISIFKPNKGCPYIDNTKTELIPRRLTKDQLTVMNNIKVSDVVDAVKKIR